MYIPCLLIHPTPLPERIRKQIHDSVLKQDESMLKVFGEKQKRVSADNLNRQQKLFF